MSGTISKIRISEDNLEKLRILKNSLNLNSYEKVIDFLIDFNLKGNSELNYLAEIKKTLSSEGVSETKNTEEKSFDEQNLKLEKEVKEVWESHREIEEINQNLISQINNLKNKFKFESGAFSKSYKAVLTVQEFEEIFK